MGSEKVSETSNDNCFTPRQRQLRILHSFRNKHLPDPAAKAVRFKRHIEQWKSAVSVLRKDDLPFGESRVMFGVPEVFSPQPCYGG